MTARAGRGYWTLALVLALATALAAVGPAWAEGPTVDELLARVAASKAQGAYRMTADFNAILTVQYQSQPFTASASGSYREWQQVGEPRRRKVQIHDLRLPLLLRPFRGALRSLIEQRLETQSEDPKTFHAHDFFILEERSEGRYLLAGVRRDIVTEAIDRYKSSADKSDPATRRAVAKWLHTSATMQSWIVRSGPPYAMEVLVDEEGLIYSLEAFYEWGRARTIIAYVELEGRHVWKEVALSLAGDSSMGGLKGHAVLTFANHCFNCP